MSGPTPPRVTIGDPVQLTNATPRKGHADRPTYGRHLDRHPVQFVRLDLISGRLCWGDAPVWPEIPGTVQTSATAVDLPPLRGGARQMAAPLHQDTYHRPDICLLGADRMDALIADLVPTAQRVVDALYRLPDGDVEWSPAAWQAWQDIRHHLIIIRGDGAPELSPLEQDDDPDPSRNRVVLALFEDHPELINPAWVDMTDRDLNAAAAGDVYRPRPIAYAAQRAKEIGTGVRIPTSGLRWWGSRHALYTIRARANGHYPVRHISDFLAEHPGALASTDALADVADADDAQIAAAAERIRTTIAAGYGVAAVGILDHLHARRATARQRLRTETAQTARALAEAEAEVARLRRRRDLLVIREGAWGEQTHRQIGQRAGLSHTMVGKLIAAAQQQEEGQDG